MSVRLMLVRHGESDWNNRRLLQGQADIGLSERGRQQASALGPTVVGLRPDYVVSSDLERVRDTATLMGFHGFDLDAQLREIDVGSWQGCEIEQIKAEHPNNYAGWRAGTFTPDNGESWNAFQTRIEDAIRKLIGMGHIRPLVVAHGGVIRAILDAFLGLAPSQIIPVAPASLTVLRIDPAVVQDASQLELFNYRPIGLEFEAPD